MTAPYKRATVARTMDRLTDAQTHNLMQKIREKTKSVKDLCASVKQETALIQSSVVSMSCHQWEIDSMHKDMMDIVLRLNYPTDNYTNKQSIYLELSDAVRCLDDAKIAQSQRITEYHQHLMNFHNAQVSFDTASCVLNELTVDMLGVASESLCHCIQQQRKLPQPRRGFFSTKDCAQAPNIFDI